jgi:hypothetical protein
MQSSMGYPAAGMGQIESRLKHKKSRNQKAAELKQIPAYANISINNSLAKLQGLRKNQSA